MANSEKFEPKKIGNKTMTETEYKQLKKIGAKLKTDETGTLTQRNLFLTMAELEFEKAEKTKKRQCPHLKTYVFKRMKENAIKEGRPRYKGKLKNLDGKKIHEANHGLLQLDPEYPKRVYLSNHLENIIFLIDPDDIQKAWKRDGFPDTRYIKGKRGRGKTRIEFSPLIEKESKKPTLFTENDKEHVRFLYKTENLNFSHLTDMRYFRDVKAKDLYYQPREENDRFQEAFQENTNIILVGPPKVGKTRLAFYEMQQLKPKKYYVFSLYQETLKHIDKLTISPDFNNENRKLIWFIDDLDYFQGIEDDVWKMYEKLTASLGSIKVIVTIREDKYDPDISQLFRYTKKIKLPFWEEPEGKKLAKHRKIQFLKSKFTGTPVFIYGDDLDEKTDIYNDDKKMSPKCRWVLRCLKLLQAFLQFVEYELLEEVYSYYRGEDYSKDDLEECLSRLKKTGFIDRQAGDVFAWEPYLDNIVSNDEDSPTLNESADDLINCLANFNRIIELNTLGAHFYFSKNFKKAIECHKRITKMLSPESDSPKMALAFHHWGVALSALANKQNGDEILFKDAFEKYKLAISYKKNFPEVYSSWGSALTELAAKTKDITLCKEAIKKCKLALEYKNDHFMIYNNLGGALAEFAKQTSDEMLFKDAFKKYELSIRYKSDFFIAYFNWGNALSGLARQTNDESLYKEAFRKYKLAVRYKSDYFLAYLNWGTALSRIAKLQDNKEEQKKFYKKACGKCRKAIECKKDGAKAYCNWGIVLFEIAELQDNKEKQKKLCREAYSMLFKSYLLFILQEKRSLTDTPVKMIKYICQEIDNTICIEEILIFELSRKASLPDNKKSLSKKDLDFLQKTKGISSYGDIIIDAILEDKKPDVAEIPDDDLLLKTAVFLANRIIDRKK